MFALLAFLVENIDTDGDNDVEMLWKRIEGRFDREDFVELANILVTIDRTPKDLLQKFWDNM